MLETVEDHLHQVQANLKSQTINENRSILILIMRIKVLLNYTPELLVDSTNT